MSILWNISLWVFPGTEIPVATEQVCGEHDIPLKLTIVGNLNLLWPIAMSQTLRIDSGSLDEKHRKPCCLLVLTKHCK